MKYRLFSVLAMGLAFAACGDDDDNGEFSEFNCKQETRENCVEIPGGDTLALLEAVNSLKPNTTLVLGAGTYELDRQVAISDTVGLHLIGQGLENTILDFATMEINGDGVSVLGVDNFLVEGLTIRDTNADGIRVEDSDGVVFRAMRATWTNVGDKNSGAYGIYPVKSKNVLVEDSFAENASDAGLYVGQCEYAIVRNNTVRGNVAGLEIENTQYADVYGNLAEDNTAGIVTFDLPGNPIAGRDVRLRDNIVRGNNRKNFAPMGVVKDIPSGTGTFAMASRRVEISGNTFENNNTIDIAIISGLLVDSDPATWNLDTDKLIGKWDDLGLPVGVQLVLDAEGAPLVGEDGKPTGELEPKPGTIGNYPTTEVVVRNNTHSGSGTAPDKTIPFGALIGLMFKDNLPVSSIIYEVTGESIFDAENPTTVSNDNRICVGENKEGTFVAGDLFASKTISFEGDLGVFGCDELTLGPVEKVVLPGN